MTNKKEIKSITKFNKINNKQKKEIVLNALTSLTLLESTIVTLIGGVGSLINNVAPIVPILMFSSSACLFVGSRIAALNAKKINAKNSKLVYNQLSGLKDELEETKYMLLARR